MHMKIKYISYTWMKLLSPLHHSLLFCLVSLVLLYFESVHYTALKPAPRPKWLNFTKLFLLFSVFQTQSIHDLCAPRPTSWESVKIKTEPGDKMHHKKVKIPFPLQEGGRKRLICHFSFASFSPLPLWTN